MEEEDYIQKSFKMSPNFHSSSGEDTKLDTPRCQKTFSKIHARDQKCYFSKTFPCLFHLIVFSPSLQIIITLLLVLISQGLLIAYKDSLSISFFFPFSFIVGKFILLLKQQYSDPGLGPSRHLHDPAHAHTHTHKREYHCRLLRDFKTSRIQGPQGMGV